MKNNNIEIDDMNIKSHLDTSFDLSKISVSEDLINRTLEAIKKQTAEQPVVETNQIGEEKNNNKKVIAWNKYIRGFAGVAAAAVILTAGYQLFLHVPMSNKEDSQFSMDSTGTQDMAKQETATTESADINASLSASLDTNAADESAVNPEVDKNAGTNADNSNLTAIAPTEETPQFSIAAGVIEDSSEVKVKGLEGDEKKDETTASASVYGVAAESTEEAESSSDESTQINPTVANEQANTTFTVDANATDGSETFRNYAADTSLIAGDESSSVESLIGETLLSFRGIFLSEPEHAQYVTITDEVNDIAITLTDQTDIQDFYTVMDKHQFTYYTEDAKEQNYTVEISDPKMNATYYMTIGDHIVVNYEDPEVSSQNIYDAVDSALLSQDLQDFISKHNP